MRIVGHLIYLLYSLPYRQCSDKLYSHVFFPCSSMVQAAPSLKIDSRFPPTRYVVQPLAPIIGFDVDMLKNRSMDSREEC